MFGLMFAWTTPFDGYDWPALQSSEPPIPRSSVGNVDGLVLDATRLIASAAPELSAPSAYSH